MGSMTKRERVFELGKKIEILSEALFARDLIPARSRSAFAKHVGINPKSLDSAITAGAISKEMQEAIESVVGIPLKVDCWIDRETVPTHDSRRHEATRKDTATIFRRYVLSEMGLVSTIRVGLSGKYLETFDPDFASISLSDFGQKVEDGSPVNGYLELSLSPHFLQEGISFGFSRVRVRIRFQKERTVTVLYRLGQDGEEGITSAKLRPRGTSQEPYWELESFSGLLSGEFVTKDAPLIKLQPGDHTELVEIELSANPHDGSLVIKSSGNEISVVKQRILERLIALDLNKGVDGNNWIVLGRQRLVIDRQ